MLDLKNLEKNYHVLLAYMKEGDLNYSDKYINCIKNEIEKLLNCDIFFNSYEEYYLYRLNNSSNIKIYIRPFKSHINLIMNFDLYQRYPNGENLEHQLFETEKQYHYCDNFKLLINAYDRNSKKYVKKERTFKEQSNELKQFLKHIQEVDIFNLEDITEEHIISYFMNEKKEFIRGYSNRYRLKAALEIISDEVIECQKIIFFLPYLKEHRKNIQYLSDEELDKIKYVLHNKPTNITFKDIAIVSLLVYTGLRAIDISKIKLSDIDWENDVIRVNQSKTSEFLELPLVAPIGNAVYNYLLHEKPKSELPYIFLKSKSKIDAGIKPKSVYNAVEKVMDEAKIRMRSKDRRGSHIFRHKMATSMLEKNIPTPIISSTLGHTSPQSLETYLSTDFVHLKECALSVEDYPVGLIGGDFK